MHVATALRATYIFSALTLMVSQADTTLFAWHPIFMTAGFLAFMVEGVLTALDFRAREGMPRVRAIQKHATLQMAASACILLGFTAIVANKVPWTGPLAMRGTCLAWQLLIVHRAFSAMLLILQCSSDRIVCNAGALVYTGHYLAMQLFLVLCSNSSLGLLPLWLAGGHAALLRLSWLVWYSAA